MLDEAWALSPVGGAAARAVRGAGLPLRQPQADLPQAPRAGRRGPRRWLSTATCRSALESPRACPRPSWPAYVAALRGPGRLRHDPPRRRRTAHDRPPVPPDVRPSSLVEQFELGLDAPICLTWELTYACNLACAHCLSSSGRRDPRELTTEQCEAVIDELQRMQVFYVNIGGGEPTIRPDFWHLLEYAVDHQVGREVLHQRRRGSPRSGRASWPRTDYVDVQISLDGATAEVNDYVRGPGSYDTAITRAGEPARTPASRTPRSRSSCTRQNIGQLDEFKALADAYGATLRLTRLRPSGRGADVWDELHPLPEQQRELYDWLMAQRRERADRRLVLPPRGVRRGAARPQPVRRRPGGLPDRPGRRRLRLPVRDPRQVPRRQRAAPTAGSQQVWQHSRAVRRAALAPDRRRLHEVRVLRLLPRRLHGGEVLHRPAAGRPRPRVRAGLRRDRARPATATVPAAEPGPLQGRPDAQPAGDARSSPTAPARSSACAESPLAGFAAREPVRSLKLENPWKQNPWFESVAVAQRRAQKRLPAVGVRRAGRRLRARVRPSPTTRPPSASSASPRTSPGQPAERDHGHDRDGPGHLAAGDDLARPASRRCTPTARSRWPARPPPAAP